MKPLVFWCRWHDAKLRLYGRSSEAVWGELDFWKEEKRVVFRYLLQERRLVIEEGEPPRELQLDEMGVEVDQDSSSSTG